MLYLIFCVPLLAILRFRAKKDPVGVQIKSLCIIQGVFRFILKLAGVTYEVQGLENIPSDRAVLYVGNHRSYFDILVGYMTVPGLTGFVAKKEMLKDTPSAGTGCRGSNCLFLDRVDIKGGLKDHPGRHREGEIRRIHMDIPGGHPQ
ncbi:MAG: lysophospholipid acyltransferase family protein [Enterocloster sp.]